MGARSDVFEKTQEQIESEIELYENDVYVYADEYVASLPEGSNPHNRLCFNGLLRYVYRHMFQPPTYEVIPGVGLKTTILDTRDIVMLYKVRDIFNDLSNRYQVEPLLANFCIFTGIPQALIFAWSRGNDIPCRDPALKPLWLNFGKLLNECSEHALSQSMLQGNFMAYATLKCWYGWREDGPAAIAQQSEQPTLLSRDDLEALADSVSSPALPASDREKVLPEIG